MWATCTSCTLSCEYAQSRQCRALCLSVSPEWREGARHKRFGGSVCLPACVSVPMCTCEENPATSCQQLHTVLWTSCFPSRGLIIAVRPHCFLLRKQHSNILSESAFFLINLVFCADILSGCWVCLLVWGFFAISASVFFLYFPQIALQGTWA